MNSVEYQLLCQFGCVVAHRMPYMSFIRLYDIAEGPHQMLFKNIFKFTTVCLRSSVKEDAGYFICEASNTIPELALSPNDSSVLR